MITPTIGRVVWFHQNPAYKDPRIQDDGSQPLAAIVVYVWSGRMVNLSVFDQNGVQHPITSVTLVQDGDPAAGGYWCEWMPYQKGQAAKTEALEAAANPA